MIHREAAGSREFFPCGIIRNMFQVCRQGHFADGNYKKSMNEARCCTWVTATRFTKEAAGSGRVLSLRHTSQGIMLSPLASQ
ncbi:hypothetical protein BaRGS_00021989, partial [Batillaria attramentaria]